MLCAILFTVSARVSNIGDDEVKGYTAYLSYNGADIESKTMGPLASTKFETVEFTHSLNVSSPIGNVYKIRVETQGEKLLSDNESSEITVARNLLLLPEPRRVLNEPGTSVVTWAEPDFDSAVPAQFTDDFESYPCIEGDLENDPENAWVTFLTEAGDWIFIDRDQYPIGGMMKWGEAGYEFIEFPGIDVHTPQSWWIQHRLFMDFNNTYFGHNDSWQYLANMYVVNSNFSAAMPQDDWAITPELCGREQLLTLWARSYDPNIPESVEFLYSTGSTDPDDFKLIRRIEELSGDWTQYAFVIPEGGKRFAIRGCSYVYMGSAQTFVDDVTFYPAKGDRQSLHFLGYNVYFDNLKVNSSPVDDLQFVELPQGDHQFAVSAVYAEGESRAVAATDPAGLEALKYAGIKVEAGIGTISISSLGGAAYGVVATDGTIYGSGIGQEEATIDVPAGIYIVRLPHKAVKVVVR